MPIIKVTKENFESQIKTAQQTVLLDFWASWCGPCRIVSPVIDEIAAERADILVGKINVDEEPELAQTYNVMSIPTLLVMRGGEVVNTAVGAIPKADILALLPEGDDNGGSEAE